MKHTFKRSDGQSIVVEPTPDNSGCFIRCSSPGGTFLSTIMIPGGLCGVVAQAIELSGQSEASAQVREGMNMLRSNAVREALGGLIHALSHHATLHPVGMDREFLRRGREVFSLLLEDERLERPLINAQAIEAAKSFGEGLTL